MSLLAVMLIKCARVRECKKKETRSMHILLISQIIILYFFSVFMNLLYHMFKKIYRIRKWKDTKEKQSKS